MVNALKRLVVLSEYHDDILPIGTAETLIGHSSISSIGKRNSHIPCHDGYLGIGSRKEADRRRDISEAKIALAHQVLQRIAWIPWVKFAGVTGSVSYGNAQESDDIDVFLVIEDGRVWLTRLLERMALRVNGVRRTYGKTDVKDLICVNYYLSCKHLDVHRGGEEDFLRALELAMMKPILHPAFIKQIYARNAWAVEYFPKIFKEKQQKLKVHQRGPFSFTIDIFEHIARWSQLAFMRVLRHPVEKSRVDSNVITFYDQKRWVERMQEMKKKLKSYNV